MAEKESQPLFAYDSLGPKMGGTDFCKKHGPEINSFTFLPLAQNFGFYCNIFPHTV